MRRVKYNPNGGPDGGNGGRGGHIILRGNRNYWTLLHLRYDRHAFAGNGGNGSKNGIIDTQSAVGGWPSYDASADELAEIKDTDKDGMPDWFEEQFGLDKNASADGQMKGLDDLGRYTNLELYLHYLVRDIVEGQSDGGVYQKLS